MRCALGQLDSRSPHVCGINLDKATTRTSEGKNRSVVNMNFGAGADPGVLVVSSQMTLVINLAVGYC